MKYENTEIIFDKEASLYPLVSKALFIGLWIGSIPMVISFFIVCLGAIGGIVPWPWAVLKKGLWRGLCPVCKEEKLIQSDEKTIEKGPFQCSCGAKLFIVKGKELQHKSI